MNAGYLSLFCVIILLILQWMGWLNPFLSQLRIRPYVFVSLLLTVYAGSGWVLSLTPHIQVYPVTYALPLVFFFYLWMKEQEEIRPHLLAGGLLAGATLFLLRYMLWLDPVLQIGGETYLVALLAVSLSLLIARTLFHVFIVIGIGVSVMEVILEAWTYERSGYFIVGDLHYRDILVFSLLVSLVSWQVFVSAVGAGFFAVRKLFARRSR
ncbi:hypothetical protein [Aneurinibacillus tyrosinisolvens]|jgi:hypothetical protein|uniref:hypothetical protein n=1 Tax=Aneurinibacillus tyrosinisolvens TaxID=1443435 RepID=UPI00063F27D8|nr:hypothetical protein [Aneurinibacillus tyrosinisolvens]